LLESFPARHGKSPWEGGMKIVIIGLSAAGLSALETILRFAPEAEITAVSEENRQPYCRCLLTQYLGQEVRQDFMTIREADRYPKNVTWLLGERALRIDPENKTVACSSGRTLTYDKLLIAAGAGAVRPEYCRDENRAYTLRFLEDALKIEDRAVGKGIVAGGGFVGLKTAYGLKERGLEVEMVVSSPHLLSMVMNDRAAARVEKDLESLGVTLHKGDDITGISTEGNSVLAALRSGKEIRSDVLVVGKGVVPRLELAREAGVAVEAGILVNDFLETSHRDVLAAGDCCQALDVTRGRSWINAVWPVAVEQGYYAGMNMAGISAAYPGSIGLNSLKTPRFHLINAGLLREDDGVTFYEKGAPGRNQFRMLAMREDVPVGLMFFNAPEDAGPVVNLIRRGKPLSSGLPQAIVRGEASLYDLLRNI
jgi:nitrite reductase (NADH) large subunit